MSDPDELNWRQSSIVGALEYWRTCPYCDGSGKLERKEPCIECEGDGWIWNEIGEPVSCPSCEGALVFETNEPCPHCEGVGMHWELECDE